MVSHPPTYVVTTGTPQDKDSLTTVGLASKSEVNVNKSVQLIYYKVLDLI